MGDPPDAGLDPAPDRASTTRATFLRSQAETPDREQVRDLLYQFYRRCADADIPELERLATTIQTWWPEILAFLRTGITNARSEGTNRVIKTIGRDAYGFRKDPQRNNSMVPVQAALVVL